MIKKITLPTEIIDAAECFFGEILLLEENKALYLCCRTKDGTKPWFYFNPNNGELLKEQNMYVKLHEQIFNSPIMEESIEVRYVWMCLLTLADQDGLIDMTIPAIAHNINMDTLAVESSINILLQPDKTNRTPASDGRRLEKIRDTFGWKIINPQYYRELRDEE